MFEIPQRFVRTLICTSVLSSLIASGAAYAQGVDMGCSPTVADNCSGGGSSSSGGAIDLRGLFKLFESDGPSRAERRQGEGVDLNNRAIVFFNQGDWVNAVALFEQAAVKAPGDPVIKENLKRARANLEMVKQQQIAERERQKRDSAAAANMQRAVQKFASVLGSDGRPGGGASSNAAGLEFSASLPAPTQNKALLPGDPKVVDLANLPSGLAPDVEQAIAGAYRNAPPGVAGRVQKGFQAVAVKDWKVALAWFEDALNHDPGNEGIKRLIDAVKDPPPPAIAPASTSAPPPPAQKHTIASLAAAAPSMSTPDIMNVLSDLLMDSMIADLVGPEAFPQQPTIAAAAQVELDEIAALHRIVPDMSHEQIVAILKQKSAEQKAPAVGALFQPR